MCVISEQMTKMKHFLKTKCKKQAETKKKFACLQTDHLVYACFHLIIWRMKPMFACFSLYIYFDLYDSLRELFLLSIYI